MENQAGNREFNTKHSMNFLASVPVLQNLIGTLTSLVKLTKEDRMQAGIFLGNEESDGNIKRDAFAHSDGPAVDAIQTTMMNKD